MGLRAVRYVQRALVGRQCGAQRITASELPSRRAAGRRLSPPLDRDEPCWTLRQRCLWGHWSRALWSGRPTRSRWACAPLRPRARPRRSLRRHRRLHRRLHPRRRHLRSPHLPLLEADPNLFGGKTVTFASMSSRINEAQVPCWMYCRRYVLYSRTILFFGSCSRI